VSELVVLHVLEALEGGTARHLVDVTRHAHGVRHEVAIPSERVGWATDVAAAGAMADAGARVHLVAMRRLPIHPRNAAAFVQLRQLAVKLRPSIVHTHSSVAGALGRPATAGLAVGRVHTPNGIPTARPALAFERVLGRWTDRLIAASESEAEVVRAERLIRPERLAVIPNGIELAPPTSSAAVVDLRAELGIPPGAPLVGCVARLVPQKAPEDYVRICASVARQRADVHFVLVGTGPQQDLVDQEVRAGRLDGRFHQRPVLPGVAASLGQLDVFVLPSRFEGGPYTPLEAMRAGVPVVLSDVVGNRDVVISGVSGELRPVSDVDGLAEAVVALLDDPLRREAMVVAGRARLAARFDVEAMGRALSDLYRQVARA
jgi:glycosyltransferase involved in cell wall biosynthesis